MRSIIRVALIMVALLVITTIAHAATVDTYPSMPGEAGQWVHLDPNSHYGVLNAEECGNDTCFYHYYLVDLDAKTWRPIPELTNGNVYETLGWGSDHDYFYYVIAGWGDSTASRPIVQLRRLSDFINSTNDPMTPLPTTLRVQGSVRGLTYSLPHDGTVNLSLYDVAGRHLGSPVRGAHQSAGVYQLPLNSGLPSGVYFAQIRLDQQTGHGTVRIIR